MQAPNISVDDVIQIIDNHKVTNIEFLEKGGQKSVFTCLLDGQKYALKFMDFSDINLDENSLDNEITVDIKNEILARASREIEIMNKCDSRTLVKLGPLGLHFKEYETKKILYFSEEYIQGEDLSKIIKRQKLSLSAVATLGIDIATSIDSLWSIGMVHRDIKPQNIMQKTDGHYVLLDTGIAFDTSGPALTKAFQIIGTQIYMSPEQLNNAKNILDFRSDLFLLGIVMYQSLTGVHPFYTPGLNTMQIYTNITSLQVTPISQVVEDVPPKLERLIHRLLSKQPHLRFKSSNSLIEQLEIVKGEL